MSDATRTADATRSGHGPWADGSWRFAPSLHALSQKSWSSQMVTIG